MEPPRILDEPIKPDRRHHQPAACRQGELAIRSFASSVSDWPRGHRADVRGDAYDPGRSARGSKQYADMACVAPVPRHCTLARGRRVVASWAAQHLCVAVYFGSSRLRAPLRRRHVNSWSLYELVSVSLPGSASE